MDKLSKTSENSMTNIDENELISVLRDSVFPGAAFNSIKMVIEYCRAANLNPLMKPVHIVPMSVKNSATGKYEFRDIIMPGINHYRTMASRSSDYAGISEPEYGEYITDQLGTLTLTYPEWCKITVYKLINGEKVPFTSKEFWIENYASKKKDDPTPNSMWGKRPFGQLAKCAEAQALRKAFPELCSPYTVEEMTDKSFSDNESIPTQDKNVGSRIIELVEEKDKNSKIHDLHNQLLQLIDDKNVSVETQNKWLEKAQVRRIVELPLPIVEQCVDYLEGK